MTSNTMIGRGSFLKGMAVAAGLVLFGGAAVAQPKMTLMYLPVSDYAPMFVAKEKGYFDALGVDVTLAPKDASSETVPLIAAGRVTAGGLSWAASFFNAAATGSTISVVTQFMRMPQSGRPPAHVMLNQTFADKGLKLADMKGRKFGVLGAGAFTVYLAAQALQSVGLKYDDVEIVHLVPPAFGQAFANGAIDAGIVFEPFATQFEEKKIAVPVSPPGFAAGTEYGILGVNTDYLKANEDAVVRMVAGFLYAARELENGGWKDRPTVDMVRKYMRIEPEMFAKMGLGVTDPKGQIALETVKAQEAFFRSRGWLNYKEPLNYDSFMRTDVALKADKLLATFTPPKK